MTATFRLRQARSKEQPNSDHVKDKTGKENGVKYTEYGGKEKQGERRLDIKAADSTHLGQDVPHRSTQNLHLQPSTRHTHFPLGINLQIHLSETQDVDED